MHSNTPLLSKPTIVYIMHELQGEQPLHCQNHDRQLIGALAIT